MLRDIVIYISPLNKIKQTFLLKSMDLFTDLGRQLLLVYSLN